MNMKNHLDTCKRKARQIKNDYPDKCLANRLDTAAQLQGFKHYTSLIALYTLLGENGVPTEMAIINAGGDFRDCPYLMIGSQTSIAWQSVTNE
jgi:hypothetical protein